MAHQLFSEFLNETILFTENDQVLDLVSNKVIAIRHAESAANLLPKVENEINPDVIDARISDHGK